MDTRGVIYIAYGEKAEREAEQSIATLRRFHDWPLVLMRQPFPELRQDATDKQKSRWAKVTMLDWTPFDDTLYLDADTRIYGDLSAGFEALAAGWDLALAPSDNQGQDWLWHVAGREREQTRADWGFEPLQLQAGVMFVRRNERTRALWERWAYEWRWYAGEDQGALLRALREAPVRIWLLGRPWNGGALVGHLFGRTR